MKAILYLLRKNVKNGIIDTLKSPLKLIVYSFIGASLVFAVIQGFVMDSTMDEPPDQRILYGAYIALLFFISIPIMLKGLSTGSSFFGLSDVNNIFVAPISEKKVLTYGIGRQLASSLFLVICFSAYGSIGIRVFELSTADALYLFGGIALMMLIVQMVTLLLFCICSAFPKTSFYLKLFIYALPVFALGAVVAYMFSGGMTLENLYAAISQKILEYIPIVGWMHGLVFGLIYDNIFNIILYGSLLLGCCLASVIIFCVTKLDYYEDVLARAESYFEFKDHIRTGKVTEGDWMGNRRIKLRKQGINKGRGASAIFYKHLREGSRRSRFMFFNINTMILLAITAIIGLAMKGFFRQPWRVTIIYLAVTAIISYVQFFFSAAGDWVKELNKPYIFLIPDDPVRKLIMAGATSIIKPFIDGAVSFAFLWVLVGGFIPDLIICPLVYGSFGCIYIASNILAQRIVGISGNRGVFITFYMGIMVVLMVPGIVIGLLALSNIHGWLSVISASVMGLPIFLWNILVSFVIFMVCKNLLHNLE